MRFTPVIRTLYRGALARRVMYDSHDVPVERPRIRVLVALPAIMSATAPRVLNVVDLMDLPRWERHGFVLVAVDPADEAAWAAWRLAHPEAR